MQRTINTITGFLKFESENNNIENQDLLSGRTTTTKAVNYSEIFFENCKKIKVLKRIIKILLLIFKKV
jgi:hypothetical protein